MGADRDSGREDDTLRVAGIVLAAGFSSRMGRNKLLFEIDGEPIVRRAVRRAQAAGLDPVVVVLGVEAEATAAAIGTGSHRTVVNPEPSRGMTSSLRVGLAAAEEADAAIMLLADMPFVSREMLVEIRELWERSHPAVVLSAYGEVHAPPTLFDASLFADLLALPDTKCPRAVARRAGDRAVTLSWPADRHRDLDRPEDAAAMGVEPVG